MRRRRSDWLSQKTKQLGYGAADGAKHTTCQQKNLEADGEVKDLLAKLAVPLLSRTCVTSEARSWRGYADKTSNTETRTMAFRLEVDRQSVNT